MIPRLTVQRVLRRLAEDDSVNIQPRSGKFQIVGPIEDLQIENKRKEIEERIEAVLSDLSSFSHTTSKPLTKTEESVQAVMTFLSRFDVACLSAYLRGTALPAIDNSMAADIVLMSDYVQHLQGSRTDLLEHFMLLVKGHMLANALMCPDLEDLPHSYEDVTFYLDTPLIVPWLGLESKEEEIATRDLIKIVQSLGGQFSVFAHTLDELENVIDGAARQVEEQDAFSTIALEALRRGTKATDLRLQARRVEDKLTAGDIVTEKTPPYIGLHQIDEEAFGHVLESYIGYRIERTRQNDINSVRSVYVMRGDRPARVLEQSRAVLVTNNGRFAQAALEFSRVHSTAREVSPVITDFSLANAAWLKTPVEADELPITQLMAFSYAALRPPNNLWNAYLTEIDRLQAEGSISKDQHVILRSHQLADRELMHLTLGSDDAFRAETVTQTVERVRRRLSHEAREELEEERTQHEKTIQSLNLERTHIHDTKKNIYQFCLGFSRVIAWMFSVSVGILLICGVIAGPVLWPDSVLSALAISGPLSLLAVLTLLNLFVGSTVKGIHHGLKTRIANWCYRLMVKRVGIAGRSEEVDEELEYPSLQ